MEQIDQSVEIGDCYLVKQLVVNGGQWHVADILETRVNEKTKRTEYFVHYEKTDKRLDEWVEIDRIDLKKGKLDKKAQQLLSTTLASTTTTTPLNPNSDTNMSDLSNLAISERKLTRHQRKKNNDTTNSSTSLIDELNLDPASAILEKEHEEITKVKYIEKIQLGKFEIDTWYFSPFPDDYGKQSKLFMCEYCLKYCKLETTYRYHISECTRRQPPGKEIYHKSGLSVFEVDGKDFKLYCQCLCLLAKLFLDHKTLYFDVLPFIFYILTEVDKNGCHLVGYFSKEKDSVESNNLACILTLPPYQRKGYGKFLIAFSYELTKLEGLTGSPEKPLSDLGRLSYRSFWSWTILNILKQSADQEISMKDISKLTGFSQTDIAETMNSLGLLKYWRGQHIICVTSKLIDDHLKASEHRRPLIDVDVKHLYWEPPVCENNKSKHSKKGSI